MNIIKQLYRNSKNIKITKCTWDSAWYKDMVGQKFKVKYLTSDEAGVVWVVEHKDTSKEYYIDYEDAKKVLF